MGENKKEKNSINQSNSRPPIPKVHWFYGLQNVNFRKLRSLQQRTFRNHSF